MGRLSVFNSVSVDGYFTDEKNDMSFAHNPTPDPEWDAFVSGNASGDGTLLFGRITYELMAGFWPTPMAFEQMPAVAEHMNRLQKVVFSRTLDKASWTNTRLIRDNLVEEIRRMKMEPEPDMVILGSGSIVSQMVQAGLIDFYQVVVVPVVLGKGRTMFEGFRGRLSLKLTGERSFSNGNVVLSYVP